MRHLRVCIYGGTDLPDDSAALVAATAEVLLTTMPAVIVTGGFLRQSEQSAAVSTDVAALAGARRFADGHGVDLRECFEAWVPDPVLDRRSDSSGSVRMSEADGVAVRVIRGRTALGRRLAMVAGVDLLITISGRQHTEVVVEHALELGLPVLPIPDAGGDSKDLLERYRERIAASFETGALDTCLAAISANIGRNHQAAAVAIAVLAGTARLGRCLVLLPYDTVHDDLYASVIESAVAQHMIPVRLDRLPQSDAIYSSFADAMQSSTAVIADITELNENVMYEVGYAHGRSIAPLIYTRDPRRLDSLPVYFRTLNVRLASDVAPLPMLIADYLRARKAARRSLLGGER